MKKDFFICYDISSDKKRRKVAELLKKFGYRCQFSVFFCSLSDAEKNSMMSMLNNIIGKKDSVISLPVSEKLRLKITVLGKNNLFVQEFINFF